MLSIIGVDLGSLSSSSESFDHHSLLPLILHKNTSALENSFQSLNDLLEAACCTLLLCESSNAKMRSLSVLNDCHHLACKRNLFHLKDYNESVMLNEGGETR